MLMFRVFCLIVLSVFAAGPIWAAELPQFDGIIEPSEEVSFSSQVPGILEKVNVERGDFVKRGEILARLQSAREEAAVRLAEARVRFGQRKEMRNESLYKKQLLSVHEKDELETELLLAELELEKAREELALRSIVSTVDGIVTERLGAPGEYVGEDPFLTVAKIDPLNVEIVVPYNYYGQIKPGMTGQVILSEPFSGKYSAEVVIADQVIDAASGTFGVRLKLPNSKVKLPAGLRCKVQF